MKLKKAAFGTSSVVVVLLVAGILAAVNLLASRHFFRIDLTDSKKYTISASTKQVLAELDDIVNIKVYLSKKLPPYLVATMAEVQNLLEEYKVYAGANLNIEYIDPGEDPGMQQKLRFMGIPQLRLNIIEKDQAAIANVYMGLAVLYGDNKEIIPALADLSTLEYDLTSKIVRVRNRQVQTIGFLAGHGEADLQRDLGTVDNELREQYFTRAVQTAGGERIPDDIAALVVAGPRAMSDRDLFEIDQYIMSGGKVIFLLDTVDIETQGLRGAPIDSPIFKLIDHYGITVQPELVLDRVNANASFQSGMFSIFMPYPFWVRVVRENVPSDHPIINSLESIVLPWASPIEIVTDKANKDDVSVSILAQSSEYSWTQKGYFDLNPRQDFMPPPEQMKPRALGVALTGRFGSYFADKGVPPPAQEQEAGAQAQAEDVKKAPDAKAQKQLDAARTIVKASPETKLIVIGSSRFIKSEFCEQFDGNRTFFLNAVDWFVIGDRLIDIRSREAGDRPLRIIPDRGKAALRMANMFGVPVLLSVFGLIQLYVRRRRKRIGLRVAS